MTSLPLFEDDRASRGSLRCSVCGYGVARETPPGPCPMCHTDDAWTGPSRRLLVLTESGTESGEREWASSSR